MATTFKNMQDAVIASLHPAIKSQSNYNLDLVKSHINKGYYEFVRKTKCIEGTVEITTVSDQFSYTQSDNSNIAKIMQPYEVRYIESGSTNIGWPLSPFEGGHSNLPRIKVYSIPEYYWIRGGNSYGNFEIGTWPIIDASGGTLKLSAFLWPSAELSADGDEPDIEEAYREALVDYALYKIYRLFQYIDPNWHSLSLIYRGDFLEKLYEWHNENYTDDEGELPSVVDVFGDW